MGTLSSDLKNMGYERTGTESPFDESGELWTNGVELVCDETALVIDKDSPEVTGGGSRNGREYFRYENSGLIRLNGGFPHAYDWGEDGEYFFY